MWRVLGAIAPKSLHEAKILHVNPPILLLPGQVMPVGTNGSRWHLPKPAKAGQGRVRSDATGQGRPEAGAADQGGARASADRGSGREQRGLRGRRDAGTTPMRDRGYGPAADGCPAGPGRPKDAMRQPLLDPGNAVEHQPVFLPSAPPFRSRPRRGRVLIPVAAAVGTVCRLPLP
jgi:hypothetical protein